MSLCFDATLRWSTLSARGKLLVIIQLKMSSDTHPKPLMMSRKEGLKLRKKNGFEHLRHQVQHRRPGCKSQQHHLPSLPLVRERWLRMLLSRTVCVAFCFFFVPDSWTRSALHWWRSVWKGLCGEASCFRERTHCLRSPCGCKYHRLWVFAQMLYFHPMSQNLLQAASRGTMALVTKCECSSSSKIYINFKLLYQRSHMY